MGAHSPACVLGRVQLLEVFGDSQKTSRAIKGHGRMRVMKNLCRI